MYGVYGMYVCTYVCVVAGCSIRFTYYVYGVRCMTMGNYDEREGEVMKRQDRDKLVVDH